MEKEFVKIYENAIYLQDLQTAAEHTIGIDELRGSTILVTGATGTIGSFIVDMLANYFHDKVSGIGTTTSIVVCGRSKRKLRDRFDHYNAINADEAGSRILYAQIDILERESFDKLPDLQVDYVIHAAGNAYPSAFVDHPDETVYGNIAGTYKLLQYAALHGCHKFLYISSGEVYSLSEEEREHWKKEYISGDLDRYLLKVSRTVDIKGARASYPVSKAAAEALCLLYLEKEMDKAGSEMETLVVRPCHTFGPGITDGDDRAHVQFAKMAIAGQDIVLNSPGLQLRSYNYVADAAAGIVSAMLADRASDGGDFTDRVVDICSEDNIITIRGLAQLIADKAKVTLKTKEADSREKSLSSPISTQVLNPEDLKKIGFKKAFTLDEGMSHYIDILLGIKT